MKMISILSKPTVRCVKTRCSGSSSSNQKFNMSNMFPLLNGEVAKKRNVTLKDNLNKMIAIGSNDLKECYDLAVELDVAHKKALKIKQEPAKEVKRVDETDIVNVSGEKDDEENIFTSQ